METRPTTTLGILVIAAATSLLAACNLLPPELAPDCERFIAGEVARLHPGATIVSRQQTAWSRLDRPRPEYPVAVGDVLFTNLAVEVRVGEQRVRYRAYCPNITAFPGAKHSMEPWDRK